MISRIGFGELHRQRHEHPEPEEPHPGGHGSHRPPSVEGDDGQQVEEVQEEADVGQGAEEVAVGRLRDDEADSRSEGAEDRSCQPDPRLGQGVLAKGLGADEGAQEGDEGGRGGLDPLAAQLDHVSHLVDEEQHHEAHGEGPPPEEGVGGNRHQGGAGRGEQLQLREQQNGALDGGEELGHDGHHGRGGASEPLAQASGRLPEALARLAEGVVRRGPDGGGGGAAQHGRRARRVELTVVHASHCGTADKQRLTGHIEPSPGPGGAAGRFFRKVRKVPFRGLAFPAGRGYFESRRGTEPQRARPMRCEAAPPARRRLSGLIQTGFLERLGTASFFVPCRVLQGGPARLQAVGHPPGTTGFDVVGLVGMVASRGPGRPRKTPGKTISADSHEYALAA